MSLLNRDGHPILKAEWLLTRACQLHCSYCEIAHKPIKEMPFFEKAKIAQRLKDWNIFPVIYGGEATMSKDFEPLLSYMNMIDLDYAIITNGLLNLHDVYRWITKYQLKNITVSIDSLDFNSTDDTAIKARAGYALLKFTEGLVRDRVNCCTITNYNISEVPGIVKEMSKMGVYTILTLVNQWKPGFRYSAPASNSMVPSQDQIESLVYTLKDMREGTCSDYEGPYLFHEPEEVWDMWLEHGVKADWHCSKFSKFTIDADGTLQCCVDWKGKDFGNTKFLDITEENFPQYEQIFEKDIWDCAGCAWSPIKLLEIEMSRGDIAHEMIRHKLPNEELQRLLVNNM